MALSLGSGLADCAAAPAPKGLGSQHPSTVIVKKAPGDNAKPPITLEYFCLQGLGELPRLILEVTDTPYTSVFHYLQGKWKEYATFGQLPVLRDGELLLVESSAIVRHLARKTCIDGSSLEDQAAVDMYFELSKDIGGKRAALHDMANHADAPKIKTYLAAAESACDGMHFVGGYLTLADVAMFHQLDVIAQVAPAVLDAYPKLGAFVKAFAAQPAMADYLDSPRRVPLSKNECGKGNTGLPGYELVKPLRAATYATVWQGP